MQLRILIPSIILIGFTSDIGPRFVVPPQWVAFREWEAALLFHSVDGPFAPNFAYENEKSYGDLANLGNLPSFRQYHRIVFTTDEWGFRKTPSNAARPTTTVVVGDSFAGGAGLSDVDTLSAQLGRLSGTGVYNGGNVYGSDVLTRLGPLIKRLKLKSGLVIYEHSERYEYETPSVNPTAYQRDQYFWIYASALWAYSPLRILLARAVSSIQDDVWLPNVAAQSVVVKRLTNGQSQLFLKSEVDNFGRARAADADFFVKLNALVRSTDNELLVILVPDKYNVYYPLLEGASLSGSPYLGLLAQNLSSNRMAVLDLTSVLREQATAILLDRKYNYHIDDSHWNAVGVERVAQAIIESRGGLPTPQSH